MDFRQAVGSGLIGSFILGIAACGGGDVSQDLNGEWSFIGKLTSNNCTQFSFLPLGGEFDLRLRLEQTQGSAVVTGQKTAGLLWSELPLSSGKVAGTYSGSEAVLNWQSTYTFPPFPFLTPPNTTSTCVMALNGVAQLLPKSSGEAKGTVVNTISAASGDCSAAWIQPLRCEMRVDGTWTKVKPL